MATNKQLLELYTALAGRVTALESATPTAPDLTQVKADIVAIQDKIAEMDARTCPEADRFLAIEAAIATNNGVDANQAADLQVLKDDHVPLP